MNELQIEKFIEKSLNDGYNVEQIEEALRNEGVEEKTIQEAVSQLKNQESTGIESNKNSTNQRRSEKPRNDIFSKIDLTDDEYMVKQRAVRNAYKVYDSSDNEILRAKQKLLKMKEEFPFKDPEDNEIFHIKAQKVMDIAGDYSLIDSETGETVAILSKEFSILKHQWDIKNKKGEQIAHIESRGRIVGFLRFVSDLASLLPHRYSIESDGEKIGQIQGKFSIRDRYKIILEGEFKEKEAIIASAIAIDALEAN